MSSIAKINTFCEEELNKFTSCKCKLAQSPNNPLSYFLMPVDYTGVRDIKNMHGKEVKAVRMNNGFYLYFNIAFICLDSHSKRHDIKDVSIQLYTDEEPIVRAEWMNVKYHPETDRTHPQPHWHIKPLTIYLADITRQVKEDEAKSYLELLGSQPQKESGFLDLINQDSHKIVFHLEDLHYAMNEDWINGINHGAQDLCEDNLRPWLRQCLESINNQIVKVLT